MALGSHKAQKSNISFITNSLTMVCSPPKTSSAIFDHRNIILPFTHTSEFMYANRQKGCVGNNQKMWLSSFIPLVSLIVCLPSL